MRSDEHAARRATAIHEAGHAVIGRVLGYPCGGATIVINEEDGEAGSHEFVDPWAAAYQWEERGRYREYRQAFRARILICMAGAEAENVLLGGSQGGDGYDREDIERTAEHHVAELSEDQWSRYEPRARRWARWLIRRHRHAIERVADGLLARGTLSGAEIDEAFEI